MKKNYLWNKAYFKIINQQERPEVLSDYDHIISKN